MLNQFRYKTAYICWNPLMTWSITWPIPSNECISDKQALVLMMWQRTWVDISLVFTHDSCQLCIHEADTVWVLFDTL